MLNLRAINLRAENSRAGNSRAGNSRAGKAYPAQKSVPTQHPARVISARTNHTPAGRIGIISLCKNSLQPFSPANLRAPRIVNRPCRQPPKALVAPQLTRIACTGNLLRLRGVRLDMSKVLLSLALVTSLGYCPNPVAQQPTPTLPTYDIVVIRPNHSLSHGTSMDRNEATLRAENVSLKHLLVNAYGIREGLMFDHVELPSAN
jgi:hypothetical protein